MTMGGQHHLLGGVCVCKWGVRWGSKDEQKKGASTGRQHMCTAFNSILFRQQWVFSSEFRMQSASDRKIKRKVEHGNSGSSRAKLLIPCKS